MPRADRPAASRATARAPFRQSVTGARSTRDASRTKAAILAAATHEFAKHGLSGARVEGIAERARTNKRMLYYYFGGKEALFLAALETAYEHIRAEEQNLRLLELPPARGVEQLIVFTWNYFLAHPEFMSLLNTENLLGGKHLKKSKKIRAMHSPLVATLDELLQRGAREGIFRSGVDPVQLYVSIAALGYFYLSNSHTLSTIFGRDLLAGAAKKQRIAHAIDFTLGYLTGKCGATGHQMTAPLAPRQDRTLR